MTLTTNSRIAGVTFLVYIGAGIGSMAVAGRATVTEVLAVVMSVSALLLGVTLYAITRAQDPDLAMLALTCRGVEAMSGSQTGAIFFAIASTIFSFLLLRGRMVPVALARLGVGASVALVVILALQRAGLWGGATSWSASATWLVWLPMLVFELTLAGWLIIKGAVVSTPRELA
jgi:hypothetical protein